MTLSWQPTIEEQTAALAQPGEARVELFVEKVVGHGEAYGLRDAEGWVALSGERERALFPLWPAAAFAERLATDDWAGAKATPIPVDELVAKLLPALSSQDVGVAVFFTPAGKGVVLEASLLKETLEDEIAARASSDRPC
jgi:hypothetical protein